MPTDQGRAAARAAVHAHMADREVTTAQFARIAGIDPATLTDFLEGDRWPKAPTQGRIEKAIGWPPGTIRAISEGSPVPTVGAEEEDQAGVLLDIDLSDLDPSARDEVRAAALLSAYQKAREIRRSLGE